MITYDYLVRKANTKDWHYVKDAISVEDAVVFIAKERVIYSGQGIGVYYFTGLNTDERYLAYLVNKLYIVSTGSYDTYAIQAFRTVKEEAEEYMKQFPGENNFNNIEEKILDDPRDLMLRIAEDKILFFVRILKDLSKIISIQERKQDIFEVKSIGYVGVDVDHNYYVIVAAKEVNEAIEKAKKLCKQFKENEEKQ